MKKELTWQKELELAEAYAHDAYDWDEEHIERCLRKALEKAKKSGVDISKEITMIRKIAEKNISIPHQS